MAGQGVQYDDPNLGALAVYSLFTNPTPTALAAVPAQVASPSNRGDSGSMDASEMSG